MLQTSENEKEMKNGQLHKYLNKPRQQETSKDKQQTKR